MGTIPFTKKYGMLIITFIFFTGMMGTRPLVPLLANELKANPLEIGIIVALFALLPFFCAIKVGRVVDQIGHKKPLLMSALFGAVSLSIPLLVTSINGVYLSQVIAGISHTVFAVSAQTYVSQLDELKRNENIMIFSVGVALGSFSGPMLGGVIAEHWGYPIAFSILGAFCLIAFMLIFFIKELQKIASDSVVQKLGDTLGLLKDQHIRLAFLLSVLILLGKDIYTAYFPLLALEYGLTNSTIGLIVSIHAAGGIFIRWMISSFLSKYKIGTIALGSLLFSGLFFLILPFSSNSILLGFISFVLGLGLGLGQPISISTTVNALPQDRVGEGLGLRLSANRLTQISAPVILGGVAQLVSISGVFWMVGLLLLLGGTKINLFDSYANEKSR